MEMESIKLRKSVVKKVRDNKKKTGTPIGYFFEQAALEKLSQKIKSTNHENKKD